MHFSMWPGGGTVAAGPPQATAEACQAGVRGCSQDETVTPGFGPGPLISLGGNREPGKKTGAWTTCEERITWCLEAGLAFFILFHF